MRGSWMVFTLVAALAGCGGSEPKCAADIAPPVAAPSPPPPKEFTMRTYYMGFLRRGPKWTAEETPEAVAAFEGHMAHIEKLSASGKMLLAGPFELPERAPRDALAGIFLFDVPTLEEAVALTKDDPAVKAGRFTIEVMTWNGPSGLTYDGHKKPPDAAPKNGPGAAPKKAPEPPRE